jgi:hypothetical protein
MVMVKSKPLPPIRRPDGRLYRPRRIVVIPWDDWHGSSGALVLGTQDIGHARVLAEAECRYRWDSYAGRAALGWWRDGFENGERAWVWDVVRGRAGVSFRAQDVPWQPIPAPPEVWYRVGWPRPPIRDVPLPA